MCALLQIRFLILPRINVCVKVTISCREVSVFCALQVLTRTLSTPAALVMPRILFIHHKTSAHVSLNTKIVRERARRVLSFP